MFQRANAIVGESTWWRRMRGAFGTRSLAAAALILCAITPGEAGAQLIEFLSQTDRGNSAEGRSNAPALSENGSIAAFASDALDLVPPNRQTHRSEVYVRVRGDSPSTERIIVPLAGLVNGPSQVGGFAPAISANGRFVAFSSNASNLVVGDTNGVEDVFLLDRDDGSTIRIEGNQGQPNGTGRFPRLSADGRWLVYVSLASNLVDDDTNQVADIFLYDRQSGETRRVSVASDSSQANADSRTPAISADGSVVAFVSGATNLVATAMNGIEQVFVHDLDSGQTEIVSVSSSGSPSNGTSFLPDLNADGSVVAFKSEGFNLVPADTNGVPDVFVHSRANGMTERVSVDDFGNQANSLSGGPAISDDGRYVAFISFSSTFDPLDGNGASDVFVVDRQASPQDGRIKRVSVELQDTGRPGGDVPDFPVAISGNGRWIGFASAAENLVAQDINNEIDAFIACNPFEADRCNETATPTPLPTATPGPAACTGDCNGDGFVTINELIRMTNIALGVSVCGEDPVAPCPAGDANGDCAITVEELVRAVGNSLNGCTRFGDLPLDEVIAICCPPASESLMSFIP